MYIITPQNLIFVSVIDFGLRPQADLFIQQSLTISHTHTHTHTDTHIRQLGGVIGSRQLNVLYTYCANIVRYIPKTNPLTVD